MPTPQELPPRRHAFTVDEVERMVATGVLAADARVELLDGDLVEMSPQGPEHAARHTGLRDRLIAAYLGRAHVRDQCPVQAGPTSLPEPDLAVVRGAALDYVARHPRGDETLLVVEVASTSQRIDREKAAVYAAAGVPVYWFIDLAARALEEYGALGVGGYGQHRVLRGGALVELPRLAVHWAVDTLF